MENDEIFIPTGSKLTASLVEDCAARFDIDYDEAMEYLSFVEQELTKQEPQEAEDPGAGELADIPADETLET